MIRVLMNMKARLKGARTGYKLLKKKSDAIKKRLNGILKQILVVQYVYHII